jgi:hypothetical protein
MLSSGRSGSSLRTSQHVRCRRRERTRAMMLNQNGGAERLVDQGVHVRTKTRLTNG